MCLPLGHTEMSVGRSPCLNHSRWRLGFPEGREQNKQEIYASSMGLISSYSNCANVSHLASTLDSEIPLDKDHNFLLSPSQKEMAKSGFHSLTKGTKENPQTPRPCSHVTFAVSSIASWVNTPSVTLRKDAGAATCLLSLAPSLLKLRLSVAVAWEVCRDRPWPSHLLWFFSAPHAAKFS